MQPSRTRSLVSCARALLVIVLCAALTVPSAALASTPVQPARLKVCIDPGHGGSFPGAAYGGVTEAQLVLEISRRLASELRRRGIEVSMTRNSDTLVHTGGSLRTWSSQDGEYRYQFWSNDTLLRRDLQARCDRALSSGADLFISVHCNAGPSSARGIEIFSSSNDPLGAAFASDVLGDMISRTGAVNRGVKRENFYVTRWTHQPAILVECGFMSNAEELARLRNPAYQTQLALGMADGIERFAKRPVTETAGRIAGQNRYSTAAQVSQAGWPQGAQTVVLASGEQFADALVAAPLAAKLGGPILTTPSNRLDPAISAELARLKPAKLVVVGGPNSIPETLTAAAAKAAGVNATTGVQRIAGRDRYEVSLNVAREVAGPQTTSVVVASGEVWPDALSIAASAAQRGEPILLARSAGLSHGAREFIRNGSTPRAVTLVGGPNTLPNQVMDGLTFTRLSGADRYETNWAVFQARYAEAARRRPMIASANVFTDALVLGPYAAAQGRPVLLVGKATTSKELRPWVYARRSAQLEVTVVGGPASVSAYVSRMLDKMRMRTY